MTDIDKKREEIDRGVSWLLSDIYEAGKNGATINYRDRWAGISAYLHSQGVVIKGEHICGQCIRGLADSIHSGASTVCPACHGNYRTLAVEPLRGDDASSS